jgi:hypothetical protein
VREHVLGGAQVEQAQPLRLLDRPLELAARNSIGEVEG